MFSLGLTILQAARMCSTLDLKEFRKTEADIKGAVRNVGERYTDNLKCILLLML